MFSFEQKVLAGLKACSVSVDDVSKSNPLGIAVSGGADSISLLVALKGIFGADLLRVITVNHQIREKSETDGDARFVEDLCSRLGVFCEEVKLGEGKVQELAAIRSKGVEDAARWLRYEAFENFICSQNLCALCLAHNQNDQVETVLMRLFGGSGIEGLGGIPLRRGKIIRPLMSVTRKEIEAYLNENGVSWRTDSTNLQNVYSRNKIRNILSPFLDSKFPDWNKGLVAAAEKARDDEEFLSCETEKVFLAEFKKSENGSVAVESRKFYGLPVALQRRCVYKAWNSIGFGERFPFRLVKEICSWNGEKSQVLCFEQTKTELREGELFFSFEQKDSFVQPVDEGFQFLFENENDFFSYEDIRFYVESRCGQNLIVMEADGRKSCCEIFFPFLVRSTQNGDEILMENGGFKKVSDILSDWKISKEQKKRIPVVQILNGEMPLAAVFGAAVGAKNWILNSHKSL